MADIAQFSRRVGHPYPVESLADLPSDLRAEASRVLPPDDPLRALVVIPPQTVPKKLGGPGGVHRLPEQAVLFTTHGILHVQGLHMQEPAATYLRGADLLYVQLTIVLLYGRLELCGVHAGQPVRMVVEYNTVRHDLIQPGLLHLLHLTSQPAAGEPRAADQTDTFIAELEKQSFKFRNALHDYALQPEERLAGYVYQPRLHKEIWHFFHRLLAPASILALTDRNMILIAEGRSSATSYGWFFTFCPRKNITHIETASSGEVQVVNVHLAMEGATAACQAELDRDRMLAWQSLAAHNLN